MTTSCRVIFFFCIMSSILLTHHISSAGPARSIALAASRAIKIPRSIRAPFRNTEMMTARGFGKRALYPAAASSFDNTNYKDNAGPWSYPKHDDLTAGDSDALLQMFTDQPIESFPIEWFGNEISSNPALIKSILRHAVDTNRDGLLTVNELLGNSESSGNY